ncbi:MAG: hypothetical protein IIB39_02650 [Candidatus Marinimicrobia bacterium]|nr:hypothetical protein [Candidatus Neomarinimicrobiota bacterium]
MKLISTLLICSLSFQLSACAVRPALNDNDWVNLSPEERRIYFENILEEQDRPVEHLRIAYFGMGGLIAFFGLGFVFGKSGGNNIISWLAFLSSLGILWGGIGAAVQNDATGQRKRIAVRELSILDHPEWRRDRIRAIREGQIDIGFEELMVISSWGEPQLKIQNIMFNGLLYEEWSYLIKLNTKVYIDATRKVAIIQTPEMTYTSKSSNR